MHARSGGCVVSNQQPRRRQKKVLRLEPSRAAATILRAIAAMIAAAVSVYTGLYHASPGSVTYGVPAPGITVVAIVAAAVALIMLTGAVVNGIRWHLARAVERLSNDPSLASSIPRDGSPESTLTEQRIPPLQVELVKPRRLPKPRSLRRVTAVTNITGDRPLAIAYLRLFENEPRTRTFIQSAWREFGYVYFLRSAASVTPAEFRHAKSTDSRGMFLTSREQFATELAKPPPAPIARRRQVLRNIAPRAIKVWDWYGSYLPMGYLCHGTIWKLAVEDLLRHVDLVVLDLSGFTPRNRATGHELQRVIDLFPIGRVMFLADGHSDRRFLCDQIHAAWQKMATGSPNSGVLPKTASLAVTDHYRRSQQAQANANPLVPGQMAAQQTRPPLRLLTARRQSRRLAAAAQSRVLQAQPATAAPSMPTVAAVSSTSGVRASRWGLAGKLVTLSGSLIFLASIALFSNYTNKAPDGPVSLLQAAGSDLFSPLHYQNFWTVTALLALVSVLTVISFTAMDLPLMAGATLTALGLVGYTLYIPTIQLAGFTAYGSSYWASLVAAVLMASGAGLAAIAARPKSTRIGQSARENVGA
jgi:hypothetical protein